jgi:tetratricopeptide (TPR) repeat protein
MRYVIFWVIGVISVITLGFWQSLNDYISYNRWISGWLQALIDIDDSHYAHDENFSFKNIYNQWLILAQDGKYTEARNLFSSVLKENIPSNIRSSTLEILWDLDALEWEKQDTEKQLFFLSGALKHYEWSLAILQNKRIEQKINLIRTIYEKNETNSRLREGNPLPSNGEQWKTSRRPPSKQELQTIGETRRTLGIYESEKNKYLEYNQDGEKVSAEEILWRSLDTSTTYPGQEDW